MEVMGRWSNLSDQGERLQTLVEIVPNGSKTANSRIARQVQKRLRPEQVSELTIAYQSGSTIMELAKAYGIHRWTVLEHLKRERVPRRHSKLDQVDIDKAVRLYALGWSGEAVGLELRVGASTIRRELKKAGVSLRRRGRSHKA